VSYEIVIAALIYIDRLLSKHEEAGACLTENNGKGVLHVALTLATKFFLDRYEKNTIFYGVVHGMQCYQMRYMTNAFISLIDFEFYIGEDEYQEAAEQIEQMIRAKFAKDGQILIPAKYVRGSTSGSASKK
jgi:hypothetical protein